MTYLGDAGDVSAEFHPRGDVETLTYRTSGTHVRFVAPGSATRGQYDGWTEFYAQHDQYRAE
jgi:hypothetical protein